MSDLHEQRVLMGIDHWDRGASVDEAKAHRTRTAGHISDAMEALQRAKRAAGHRKLGKSNKGMHAALSAAHEACMRAHEMAYESGETEDVEEEK